MISNLLSWVSNEATRGAKLSLPSPRTMRAMSSPAILLLFESRLLLTTKGIVIILRSWQPVTRGRINVLGTILLPTRPTPGPTTSLAHVEFVIVIQTTGEHIITGGILESPTPTPRTLFCVCRAGFRHLLGGRKDSTPSIRKNGVQANHGTINRPSLRR